MRKQSLLSRFPLLHWAFNAAIIGLFVWGLALGVASYVDGAGTNSPACVAANVPVVGAAAEPYCR